MFCQKCGAQLEDAANFCDKCGNAVNGVVAQNVVKEKIPDTQVLLQVKPKFKFWYFFVWNVLTCVGILLIFTILSILLQEWELLLVFGGISCLVILLGGIIRILFKKAQFKNMRYDFYRTKIEYSDSFLNKAQKEVKYKYIRETILSRRVTDRLFGFGVIALFTNAESGVGNGIGIPCVENSEEVYKEIKQLLESNK